MRQDTVSRDGPATSPLPHIGDRWGNVTYLPLYAHLSEVSEDLLQPLKLDEGQVTIPATVPHHMAVLRGCGAVQKHPDDKQMVGSRYADDGHLYIINYRFQVRRVGQALRLAVTDDDHPRGTAIIRMQPASWKEMLSVWKELI